MFVNAKTTPDLLPCRAFLNGVDVSNDCIEADDEAGYVLLIKEPRGSPERVEGDVKIEFPKRKRAPSGKEVMTYR